jgi:hypothetical protein
LGTIRVAAPPAASSIARKILASPAHRKSTSICTRSARASSTRTPSTRKGASPKVSFLKKMLEMKGGRYRRMSGSTCARTSAQMASS